MSSLVYNSGPMNIKVQMQGYLASSNRKLMVGILDDPAASGLNLNAYESSILLIGKKESFILMPDEFTAFIKPDDIISVANRRDDGGPRWSYLETRFPR